MNWNNVHLKVGSPHNNRMQNSNFEGPYLEKNTQNFIIFKNKQKEHEKKTIK